MAGNINNNLMAGVAANRTLIEPESSGLYCNVPFPAQALIGNSLDPKATFSTWLQIKVNSPSVVLAAKYYSYQVLCAEQCTTNKEAMKDGS